MFSAFLDRFKMEYLDPNLQAQRWGSGWPHAVVEEVNELIEMVQAFHNLNDQCIFQNTTDAELRLKRSICRKLRNRGLRVRHASGYLVGRA